MTEGDLKAKLDRLELRQEALILTVGKLVDVTEATRDWRFASCSPGRASHRRAICRTRSRSSRQSSVTCTRLWWRSVSISRAGWRRRSRLGAGNRLRADRGGAPSSVRAMVNHLINQTMPEGERNRLAAYYTKGLALSGSAPNSAPPDLDPRVAIGLGIDPAAPLTREQINGLLAGRRTDGKRSRASSTRPSGISGQSKDRRAQPKHAHRLV